MAKPTTKADREIAIIMPGGTPLSFGSKNVDAKKQPARAMRPNKCPHMRALQSRVISPIYITKVIIIAFIGYSIFQGAL